MLKNTSSELVCLKWGGVFYYLSPNQFVNVEEKFDVHRDMVDILETRFVNKFNGKIVKFNLEDIPMSKQEEIIEPEGENKAKTGIKTRGRRKKG